MSRKSLLIASAVFLSCGSFATAGDLLFVDFYGYSATEATAQAALDAAAMHAWEQFAEWEAALEAYGYTITAISLDVDDRLYVEKHDLLGWQACWHLAVTFELEGGPVPIPFPMPPRWPPPPLF